MAKVGRPRTTTQVRTFPCHTTTYLKPEHVRGVEAAAERDSISVSTWLRRLIIAELGRIAAREQLTA